MHDEKRLTLFVFIDAFGWELVKRWPFMEDIIAAKAPLDTIFGYSSTCDPTILTGKLPRDHGHFAFYYYNPMNRLSGTTATLTYCPRRSFRGAAYARGSVTR